MNISQQKYLQYLTGENYYKGFDKIDFDNVTLNLLDYYLGERIWFRNGTRIDDNFSSHLNELPQFAHAWVDYGEVIKCFGIRVHYPGVAKVTFHFNSSIFPGGIRNNDNFKAFVHLPNKMLTGRSVVKFIWPKRTIKKEYFMRFKFKQVEILRRRNKRSEPCQPDSIHYDDYLLGKHITRLGCKAPYHVRINRTICTSKEKMKRSSFDPFQHKHTMVPCTSMETIAFHYSEFNDEWKGSGWFHVTLKFPNRYKIIKMIKAVDLQTAIGNAGGYVGLFLGNISFLIFVFIS